MRLLEINEVKKYIRILGFDKVLNKIKENKGYLKEKDFHTNTIIDHKYEEQYTNFNIEITNFSIKKMLLQMESIKKSCTAKSMTYFIKNVSHTGYVTYYNGISGIITK